MKIEEHVYLKNHTSIGVGGPCKYFVHLKTKEDIKEAFEFTKKNGLQFYIIGGGTDLLIGDNIPDVVFIHPEFKDLKIQGQTVYAGSGVSLPILSNALLSESLSGMEELSEIPGTIGGAAMLNAGAFGREIGELISEIVIFNGREFVRFDKKELDFSYRSSNIPEGSVIVEVVLKLKKGNKFRMSSLIKEVKRRRRSSQPIGVRTAGCAFKNPSGSYSAGQLLDMVGLRGYRYKDMEYSEKHANFLVNRGNGTFSQAMRLLEIGKSKVLKRFDIELFYEIKIIEQGVFYG